MVLLEGIFALIFGILLLANPAAATATLVQLLGFYFVIHGIFQLVSMFTEPSMWGWKLCGGILGILAGYGCHRSSLLEHAPGPDHDR